VVGTIKWRLTLDAVLGRYAAARLGAVPVDVREALRMGAYQILFLERVPAHAAVSDAVTLAARRSRRSGAFTNAILRKVADSGTALLSELTSGNDVRAVALRHSHPEWIVRLWRDEFGAAESEALMAAGNRPAERCLRVNRRRATLAEAQASLAGDGIDGRAVDGFPDALVISGPAVEASNAFRDGLVTPQSRASQLVGHVVAEGAGSRGRLADLCAAPGGKTSHLRALLPEWEITAVESDGDRAAEMEVNLSRLDVSARVVVRDVLSLDETWAGTFEAVLLDAPCSGLGTLASRPDLRWRRRSADVPRLAALQGRLLKAASRLVAEGGTLTYCVCTLTQAETVAIVDDALGGDGWSLDDLSVSWRRFTHAARGGCLLTLPSRDGTSGFFVARLRRAQTGDGAIG